MQENQGLKKKQFFSAQVDLSKFKGNDFEKATEDEKKQQDVMGESTTFFKDGMRRLRKNPLAGQHCSAGIDYCNDYHCADDCAL